MNSALEKRISLVCPECGTELVAATDVAAKLVSACVDHPSPNVKPAHQSPRRCIEHEYAAPFRRCQLDDGHKSLHRIGDTTWMRYDKWSPWCKEALVEMGRPPDDE